MAINTTLTSERDYNTLIYELQRREQGHVTYKANLPG